MKQVLIVITDKADLNQPLTRSIKDVISKTMPVRVIRPHDCDDFTGGKWNDVEEDKSVKSFADQFMRIAWETMLEIRVRLLLVLLPAARPMKQYFNPSVIACLILPIKRNQTGAIFIAVDFHAMLACQLAGVKAHLLSLEILHHDLARLLVRPKLIKSCITQNHLRYLALFPEGEVEKIIVPNFPRFSPERRVYTGEKKGLVFAGTVFPGFGALAVIRLVLAYNDLEVTFCGWMPDTIKRYIDTVCCDYSVKGRINVFNDRLGDEAYIERLRQFRIGLAFYDFDDAEHSFFGPGQSISPWSVTNYLTGFPGKIGMCLAAGVPVIASRWPGTEFVDKEGVGLTVNQHDPAAIRAAIDKLESNYELYESNAIDLASSQWLEKSLNPFIQRLARDTQKS